MNCFECFKVHDTVAAVGVCLHCGAGLCIDHMIDAREFKVGGTTLGCPHELPKARQALTLPDAAAATLQHAS